MEAKKPATKPAKAQKSNAPGIKNASLVILACMVVTFCLFFFWFGNPSHFQDGNPDGHPINIWGTIYKGGIIVPILQGLFLTVIVLCVERFFALNSAKGKGDITKW